MSRIQPALPRDYWLRTILPNAEPHAYGCAIHRFFAPKEWVEQLARVPEDKRNGAEQYLREIAHRMRVQRTVKSQGRFQVAEQT